MEASTVIEAWPLGADLKQKPLYNMTAAGVDPKIADRELVVISRGLEDVAWWSAYKLATAGISSIPTCRWYIFKPPGSRDMPDSKCHRTIRM
jgi:hypothetical protein